MGDRLEGKVAIITGGTSGIGYRTVEIFVEQGARVLIAARSEDVGQALADRLGDSAFFVRTDVTQEDDIRVMIDAAMKRWGQIDYSHSTIYADVIPGLTRNPGGLPKNSWIPDHPGLDPGPG